VLAARRGRRVGRAGFVDSDNFLCASVFKTFRHSLAIVIAVLAVVAGAGSTFAGDDFPLAGSYTQNVPCKGDGSDPVAVRVKISPQEIVSNVGVCTILDIKHDSDTVIAHVECQFPAGPLMGNISFTPRPDQTVDFVDRDGNYKAVLHRCPN
jgi:hypothetical protein